MSPFKWLFLLTAVLLSACQPIPTTARFSDPWCSDDLRILEAPGASDPSYDLVAAYARLTASDLEVRFDLLGSPDPFSYDLYVVVDTGPGGGGRLPYNPRPGFDWDIALGFPAQGFPRAFNAAGSTLQIRPRIHRDSVQDAAIVRLRWKDLIGDPLQYQVYAFLVKTGENQAADSIGPLLVGGPAPDVQASLSLAFWDAFPAATPAQALRRWSGAHTGPYGQRHGLSILINAAAQNGVPITILDIKRPEQLLALEAVEGLITIQQMVRDNLLLLPDLSYGDPLVFQASLQTSRAAGERFRIPASQFLYHPGPLSTPASQSIPESTRAVFTYLEDASHVLQWNNIRLVPLAEPAAAEDAQVDDEGLTIAARTALLHAALSSDPTNLVALGGDLPDSPWGDSLIAAPAFRYIAGHPWINVLDREGLLHFPSVNSAYECPDWLCPPIQDIAQPDHPQIREALQSAPDGLFRSLAWQMYLRLTESTPDPVLQALRAGYLGQVGPLLAAARWNAAPKEQSICVEDINWDGTVDCILSSQSLFLVLDPVGGSLVFAAARIGNEAYEWIGPRSQFVVGLGDSFEWHPERGRAGDPQEIHGAFTDSTFTGPHDTWQTYQAETETDVITLTNMLNGTRKTFRLTGQGVLVTIEEQQQGITHIPLALIDRRSYEPGGYSRYHLTPGSSSPGIQTNAWEMDRGASLFVTVEDAEGTLHSFADSRSLLGAPEDPNTGYPPGHFVPFPLAVLELQTRGNYSVEFRLEKR